MSSRNADRGSGLAAMGWPRISGHGARLLAIVGAATLICAVLQPMSAADALPRRDQSASPAVAKSADFGRRETRRSAIAVDGIGGGDGYHIRIATGASGFGWRDIATIRPANLAPSTWYGYQCLTGDGRYVAVAVLPGDEINENVDRDRGAYAYSVDIATGKVIPLASGVGLKYHSPGCGLHDLAAFTANLGSDESSTEVLSFNLTNGEQAQDSILSGQVTSVVPTAAGLLGAQNESIVSVPVGGTARKPRTARTISDVDADAYDLRPNAQGGVDFLSRDPRSTATRVQQLVGRDVRKLGEGETKDVNLFAGAGGHNYVIGANMAASSISVRDAKALPLGATVMSLDGQAAFGAKKDAGHAKAGRAPTNQTRAAAQASLPEVESEVTHRVYTASGAAAPQTTASPSAAKAAPATKLGTVTVAGRNLRSTVTGPAPKESTTVSARAKAAVYLGTGDVTLSVRASVATKSAIVIKPALSPGATTPKCSVPRLQANLEAMQPSNAQVNWATQMAEQGLLTGSAYTRPSNFANMGLAAYAPSSDFPPVSLSHPSGSSQTTVPRSVMLAIEAQESNFNQASWHALPGIAGDPLIGDYYGAGGTINTINYPNADCGYGIAQVTSGMAAADTSISAHGQMKVAVDYQENIAAGLQILEKTWNTLYADGITANGGDPKYLENWYLAAWAYNTGIQPTAAYGNTSGCNPSPTCTGTDGTWGVGWSNNPQNPDYNPSRLPYLQATYADAAHPSSWPYEERIMGWMASPILRYGYFGYNPATYNGGSSWIHIPPVSSFCDSTDDCNPGDTAKNYCSLTDSECWWHNPVTWVSTCSTTCATSTYEYATGSAEPTYTAKYQPTCNQDTTQVPSGSLIVDDLSNPSQNDEGCSGMNWSNSGSFAYSPGTNSSGDPVGDIDTHQLGAGFGGHILFTHTEPSTSTSLINTGTWTPTLPSRQYYEIKIHLPATGATATDVVYTINPGGSAAPWKIRVNQDWGSEQWVTLGRFGMQNGGNVVLTNASNMTPQKYDVAYDAVAFIPEGGDASTPLGGSPGIKNEPDGSNPAWVTCTCSTRTAGDPVDTASGYFSEDATDLSTPGLGEQLAVSRTYSAVLADSSGPAGSTATVNGAFGYGWTWNYGMTANADGSGNVTVHQEDGSSVPFTASAGTYAPTAPRYNATLTKSGSTYVFTRRGSEQFIFDVATGHLVSESDLAGRVASTPYSTTLTYNAGGQLTTASDPSGRTYAFGWTGTHITKVTSSGGQEVDYAYSSAGDLTDVYGIGSTRSGTTVGDQDHAQYSYSSTHLMLTERTPANYGKTATPTPVTTNVYDTSDRVVSQTDPDGDKTTFVYGPDGTTGIAAGQTLVTDPSGNKSLDTYANGLLASETVGYGTSAAATTSYQYDPATLGVLTQTNPDGSVETFGYDDAGNRISSSDGLGRTTSYQYNSAGQITTKIDATGLETQWSYNSAGAVTSETVSNSGQSAESANDSLNPAYIRQASSTYTDTAHPSEANSATDANGNKTSFTYDNYGDLTSRTDALSHTTEFGWSTALGRKTSVVGPSGVAAGTGTNCTPPATGCTTYAYDAFGNVVTRTDALGHAAKGVFDADGNQLSATDANGHTTTTSFDAADRPLKVTKPSGSTITTSYNPDGTIAKTTNTQSASTTYTYDARDDQLTSTNPDARTTTQTWTVNGQVATTKDPNGVTTTNSYDAAGELSGHSYSDSTHAVAFGYDLDGRMLTMTDATGTSSNSYDVFGELTSATNGASATTTYTYDADGNTLSIQYPGSGTTTVTRQFNAANELTAVIDPSNAKSTFGYNADGAPTSESLANGDTVSTVYDGDDQESSTTLIKSGTTLGTIAYTRDNDGDLLTQTPSAGAPGMATTYTYTSDEYLASSSTSATTNYAYDAAGDPTTTAAGTQSYDAAGQLCWTSSTTVASPTCSTVPSGATKYGYDADGNRTSATPSTGTTSALSYNGAGELVSATAGGATVGTYTYDGRGLRASKTTASGLVQYSWDERGSIPTLLADGTTDYITGPNGAVIEQYTTAASSWLFQDAHGSTVDVLSATGAITGSYGYAVTGAVASHSGTATTAIEYAGAYLDAETGFYYLQARYYDPATSEFVSIDPDLASTNQPYAYAGDDPVNAIDPLGLWSWTLVAAGISVVTGIAGVALDGTAVGAVIGLPLEGISLAAGGFAIAGDCFGAFGAERDAVGCGLDWLAEGTAGFGGATELINGARAVGPAAEAADDAARASRESGYTLGRTSRLEREARAKATEEAESVGLKYSGKAGDWSGLAAGGAGLGWTIGSAMNEDDENPC